MNPMLEFTPLVRECYMKATAPVCLKHSMTGAELDVLLFLANNPEFDRATDIVERRYLAKSQVSASVAALEKRGYLTRSCREGDRRTVHLSLCPCAQGAVEDGRRAQERFGEALLAGFSEVQRERMKVNMGLLVENMRRFVREDDHDIL